MEALSPSALYGNNEFAIIEEDSEQSQLAEECECRFEIQYQNTYWHNFRLDLKTNRKKMIALSKKKKYILLT